MCKGSRKVYYYCYYYQLISYVVFEVRNGRKLYDLYENLKID